MCRFKTKEKTVGETCGLFNWERGADAALRRTFLVRTSTFHIMGGRTIFLFEL